MAIARLTGKLTTTSLFFSLWEFFEDREEREFVPPTVDHFWSDSD